MVKITIIGSDTTTGGLTFDGKNGNGDRKVKHKDEVKWILGNNCGVALIIKIHAKLLPPSADIWDIKPHAVAQSTDWKGNVNETAVENAEWHYHIKWQDTNGKTHNFDPKIIVNSHK